MPYQGTCCQRRQRHQQGGERCSRWRSPTRSRQSRLFRKPEHGERWLNVEPSEGVGVKSGVTQSWAMNRGMMRGEK